MKLTGSDPKKNPDPIWKNQFRIRPENSHYVFSFKVIDHLLYKHFIILHFHNVGRYLKHPNPTKTPGFGSAIIIELLLERTQNMLRTPSVWKVYNDFKRDYGYPDTIKTPGSVSAILIALILDGNSRYVAHA